MSTLFEMAEELRKQQSQVVAQEGNSVGNTLVAETGKGTTVMNTVQTAEEVHQADLKKLKNSKLTRTLIHGLVVPEKPEPALLGHTSVGASVEWINWYMESYGVTAHAALIEAKYRVKRLRRSMRQKKQHQQ